MTASKSPDPINIESDVLSPQQARNLVYGYLTSGNSVHDLIDLIVQGTKTEEQTEDQAYVEYARELVQEIKEAYKHEDEGSFKSATQEIQYYLEVAEEHKYEAHSVING